MKINAPTFAYKTLYGKEPKAPLSGRTSDPKKMWNGLDVDKGLKDEWLESLNAMPVEMRSSEEGKGADRPAFVVTRMPEGKDKLAKDMVKALRKEGLVSNYDIGQGKRPRICVTDKMWKGKKGWEKWWEKLPGKITNAYDSLEKKAGINDLFGMMYMAGRFGTPKG